MALTAHYLFQAINQYTSHQLLAAWDILRYFSNVFVIIFFLLILPYPSLPLTVFSKMIDISS